MCTKQKSLRDTLHAFSAQPSAAAIPRRQGYVFLSRGQMEAIKRMKNDRKTLKNNRGKDDHAVKIGVPHSHMSCMFFR